MRRLLGEPEPEPLPDLLRRMVGILRAMGADPPEIP